MTTIQVMSDPVAMAELAESEREFAAGHFITGEELRPCIPVATGNRFRPGGVRTLQTQCDRFSAAGTLATS